jgi:dTDP-4-amino-4,6-dideoxygalactose transaminase
VEKILSTKQIQQPEKQAQANGSVTRVPSLDLQAQFAGIRDEVMAAITRVMESQHFILGSEVASLEKEIADFVDCNFAVGCASGSDALLLALMAFDIGPGDEVITTPFTFGATAGSILRLGARVVFVDIQAETYNLDPEKLEAAITPRTRAIMPVHLFGLPADMSSILEIARRHNLPVIEDAAQAIGAKYRGKSTGGLGDVGCFSFFPSKNLGAAGDGGMVVTNDSRIAERVKILRHHGSPKKYQYELLGMNSRLDALQAAILRVKLKYLPEWTAARQRNARRYGSLFSEYGIANIAQLPKSPDDYAHVYNQYVIRTPERDGLKTALARKEIMTEIYYPSPLHVQPAFLSPSYQNGDFPNAESACEQVLALPVYPELTEGQQRLVVENIAAFLVPKQLSREGARNA